MSELDAPTLAAIVAAVEVAWPRPGATASGPVPIEASTWRFSARWWSPPAAGRRSRPW